MKLKRIFKILIISIISLSFSSCSNTLIDTKNGYKVVETGPFKLKVDYENNAIILDVLENKISGTVDLNNNKYLSKYNITGIGNNAFENATKVEKIVFSKNIEYLGENAFQFCNNLKEIEFNASLIELHPSALSTLNLLDIQYNTPNSIQYFPSYELSNERLFETNIIYENSGKQKAVGLYNNTSDSYYINFDESTQYISIKNIPENLCGISLPTKLKDINIAKNALFEKKSGFLHPINNIFNEFENGYYLGNNENQYMFLVGVKDRNCNNFVINEKTMFINEYTFEDCINLKEITIPNNIKRIPQYAFYCSGLEKINLHNNIYKIEDCAFKFSNLQEINLPSNLKTMGFELFSGTKLTHIEIPSSVSYINKSFVNCQSLESLIIPDSINYINGGSFYGCINLKFLQLPSICSGLNKSSFSGCKLLEDIYIPYGVAELSSYQTSIMETTENQLSYFGDCENLKNVYIPESIKYIDNLAFKYVKGATIYLQHKSIPLEFEDNWNYENKIVLGYSINNN